ncbi:energy transducer TonB, partial [Falsiroseomonas sp.]|uniref:energy transducer TonB n=1 Tax=Falsiroseomonas sp. TaxID=2870721 RepID=UPI00271E5D7A
RPTARAEAAGSALAGNPGPASAMDSGPAGPTSSSGPAGGGQGAVAASPGQGAGEGAGARQLPAAYTAALVRILQRNLRYPPAARAQGIEGTATVRFVIARDGTVQASQLVRGTGSVLLDHEAMALIRRVSPLPRLPADFPDAQAVVLAPIGFSIR